jgi:hypothetical protein
MTPTNSDPADGNKVCRRNAPQEGYYWERLQSLVVSAAFVAAAFFPFWRAILLWTWESTLLSRGCFKEQWFDGFAFSCFLCGRGVGTVHLGRTAYRKLCHTFLNCLSTELTRQLGKLVTRNGRNSIEK